jgi:uncharacterized membrane protein
MSFLGQILFLVAMSRFSDYYREPVIFRNTLYAFITGIVGGAAFIALFFAFFMSPLGSYSDVSSAPGVPLVVYSFLLFFALIWLFLFIITLIQGIFYKRAFNALAEKSLENNFRTAGQLMLIGGALTIIFVGSFVFFIGWFFALAGFFSMKLNVPPVYTTRMQQSSISGAKKRCPFCGAEQEVDAIFCSHCGKKL